VTNNTKKVKLALLVLISTILLLAGISIVYYQYHNILKDESLALEVEHNNIHNLYENSLQQLKHELTTYSNISLSSDEVSAAVYQNDRESLLKLTKPLFKLFKENNTHISIMTFRMHDGITLLRLHKPNMFGDALHPSRKGILKTNKEHTYQSGFEVGKLKGAYRVITPIFHKHRYVGSLELGVEPEYILNLLKQIYPLEYALLIEPTNISASISSDTLAKIEDFYLFKSDPFFIENNNNINLQHVNEGIRISYKNHPYIVSDDLRIYDTDNRVIAKILIAKDINILVKKTDRLIKNAFLFTILLILILGGLSHLSFNYFINKLNFSQRQLETFNESLGEEIIKQTHEQNTLLSLFDKGDSVLFKWNNDEYWSIESISDSVTRLMGYTPDDFLSKKVQYASCIHPDDIETVTEEVKHALDAKLDFFTHEPYRILSKEGEIKWIHDNTTLVRDTQGHVTHFVGVISDISEVRQKDQQLMHQSRLAQMGELISMIAHQWRQPLGAISATAIALKIKIDLEKYDLSKEDEREICLRDFKCELDKIEDLTQTLTSTITDFRNFYQPNKHYTMMNIHEPLTKVLNIIQGSFISNKITLVQELTHTLELKLLGNEIMQVVLNIFKNAQDNFQIKETKDREMLMQSYDIENGIELKICDNGGGIDETILDKVFDPYFSTKNDKNGTGLGLYMSKIIIEEHHKGSLRVINTDNGVCFYISLYTSEI